MMTPASWLLQTDSADNNRAFWNAGSDWTSPIEMGTQWIATSALRELIPDNCRLTSKRPSQQLKPQTPILDVLHSKPKAITTCKTWIEGWWSKHKFFFLAWFCKYFKSKIVANLQKLSIWKAYRHPSITCCNKNTPLPNQRTIILPKTPHTDRLTSLQSVNANESLSPRNKRLHSRNLKSIIITGKVKECGTLDSINSKRICLSGIGHKWTAHITQMKNRWLICEEERFFLSSNCSSIIQLCP
jgi:hypothetical protein